MLTTVFLLLIVLANSAGDVFITRGMKRVGEIATFNPGELFSIGKRVITSLDFLLGVLCIAIGFLAFLAILSWADMSFVVPATSLVYVVTIFGAKFILKEKVDRLRWAGTVLVCLGVALICLP